MKTKNFIIPLVVYPFDVMISIGETDAVLFKKLTDGGVAADELSMAKMENIGNGRYCLFATGQSLIPLKLNPETPFQYGVLQHEIFHVATAIMWRIGMKLKIKTSDEAYAYLIQYLTTKIYEQL